VEIIDYIDGLSRRLAVLPPASRTAFSLWCTEALFHFSSFLATFDPEMPPAIRAYLDASWKALQGGPTPDSDPLRKRLSAIRWDPDDVDEDDAEASAGAVELTEALTCLFGTQARGDARLAAQTAERVINALDYRLSMVEGVDQPMDAQPMRDEVARQERALQALERGGPLTKEVLGTHPPIGGER
jgi:hypothetical protein